MILLSFYYTPRREKIRLCCIRTTKPQTNLRIRSVWSAPSLFAYWKVLYMYLNWLHANLVSIYYCPTPSLLWSWIGWFEEFLCRPTLYAIHRLERHVIAIKWPLQRSGGHELVSSKRYKSACAPIEDSGHPVRIWSGFSMGALSVAKGSTFFLQAED